MSSDCQGKHAVGQPQGLSWFVPWLVLTPSSFFHLLYAMINIGIILIRITIIPKMRIIYFLIIFLRGTKIQTKFILKILFCQWIVKSMLQQYDNVTLAAI
jgi:hypothetical protein